MTRSGTGLPPPPAVTRHLPPAVTRHLPPAVTRALAAGRDAALAADLEAAAHAAAADLASQGRMALAAAWLAQASVLSPVTADAGRLVLDAVDVLLRSGDIAEAEALAPRAAGTPRGPRRSAVLGHLDLLAARPASAEVLLQDAWQAHDPAREPLTGAQAATGLLSCRLLSGRLSEAVSWGERAVDAAGAGPEPSAGPEPAAGAEPAAGRNLAQARNTDSTRSAHSPWHSRTVSVAPKLWPGSIPCLPARARFRSARPIP